MNYQKINGVYLEDRAIRGLYNAQLCQMDEYLLHLSSTYLKRIKELLDRQDDADENPTSNSLKLRKGSNCHITANYVAGISNSIGRIDTVDTLDQDTIFDDNGEIIGVVEMCPEKALQTMPLPLLARIFICNSPSGGHYLDHSIIITHIDKNGEAWAFEQNGHTGPWQFRKFEDVYEKGADLIYFASLAKATDVTGSHCVAQ